MNGSDYYSSEYYLIHKDAILEGYSPYVKPDSHDVIILVLYGILFLASIFGNSMVCLAVLCQREMRTVTNFYIVNLAIADLLISLLCLPVNAINGVSMAWFLGEPLCKVVGFFPLVSLCVSIYTLMMIAVDRYLAICRPLKFQISVTRVIVVVTIIWLAALVVASPLLIVNDVERMPGLVRIGYGNWLAACKELGWEGTSWQKFYYLYMTLVNYVLPLTVIAVAYRNVCKTLWSGIPTEELSHAETQKLTKSSTEKSKTASQIESRRKVARMLIVVVLIFAICLLPLQIVNILRVFGYFNKFNLFVDRDRANTPFLITSLLTYLNSAVNPIIYNFMSAKFRKAFRAMLCCKSGGTTPRIPTSHRTLHGQQMRASRRTNAVSSGANTECVPMTNFSSKMDT